MLMNSFMNRLKKILGVLWIILGPLAVILMCMQAWEKVSAAPQGHVQLNTALQWGIILLVFIPIAIGLVIFGRYALSGKYAEETGES